MKYIVAVSGGVDSMVLLDMLVKDGKHELIVAHFDHGIRPDSHLDAAFVKEEAEKRHLPFETRREALGATASEDLARQRRYAFLREVSRKHSAPIITAHHLDDLVETIAINFTRGTGWRGLAALDSDIHRPLLAMEKASIVEYAKKQGITWREDSTNVSDAYLRNRLRRHTKRLPTDAKDQLRALHARQKELKAEIRQEVRALIGDGPEYSRYLFSHIPAEDGVECLREASNGALTRPQLARLLHAVKVAKPGSVFEAGGGIKVHFSTRHFSL